MSSSKYIVHHDTPTTNGCTMDSSMVQRQSSVRKITHPSNTLNMISSHMVCNVTMVAFHRTFLMNKVTNIDKDDGRLHPLPKPNLLLSATSDELLSWVIEIGCKITL